jgi:hypothetical protein
MFRLQITQLAMLSVVSLFFISAPLEYFGLIKSMSFFPLYHWELGFGRTPIEEKTYHIYLTSINDVELSDAIRLDIWLSQKGKWVATSNYKIPMRLGIAVERQGSDVEINKIKKTLEEFFFIHNRVHQADYYLQRITYNPLDYYKKQGKIKTKIIGRFRFVTTNN